jgi:hypothetical protein
MRTERPGLLDPSPLYYSGDLISPFLALPKLRAFWPFSSLSAGDHPMDISGQDRHLTNNGSTAFAVHNNLVPYADLDGTDDYFSRADETGLDITGALTLVTICWFDAFPSTATELIGKYGSGVIRSYGVLAGGGSATASMIVTTDGTPATNVLVSSPTLSTDLWHTIVGRYTPSSELAIFSNGTWNRNTTSIPASIYSGAESFRFGYRNAANSFLNGRIKLGALYATDLSDDAITWLYEQVRKFLS